MNTQLLQEFLDLQEEQLSYANSGSVDDFLMKKYRLGWLKKLKLFENLYRKMHSYPFARTCFIKAKRSHLFDLLEECEIKDSRTGKRDFSLKKAQVMIKVSLEKTLKPEKKTFPKWLGMILKLSGVFSIPFIVSAWLVIEQAYPIFLLIGIFVFLTTIPLIINKVVNYFSEKWWYKVTEKMLGISKIKKKLLDEFF